MKINLFKALFLILIISFTSCEKSKYNSALEKYNNNEYDESRIILRSIDTKDAYYNEAKELLNKIDNSEYIRITNNIEILNLDKAENLINKFIHNQIVQNKKDSLLNVLYTKRDNIKRAKEVEIEKNDKLNYEKAYKLYKNSSLDSSTYYLDKISLQSKFSTMKDKLTKRVLVKKKLKRKENAYLAGATMATLMHVRPEAIGVSYSKEGDGDYQVFYYSNRAGKTLNYAVKFESSSIMWRNWVGGGRWRGNNRREEYRITGYYGKSVTIYIDYKDWSTTFKSYKANRFKNFRTY